MAITCSFTLDPKTVKKLKELSKFQDKPRSALLREWINEKYILASEQKAASKETQN